MAPRDRKMQLAPRSSSCALCRFLCVLCRFLCDLCRFLCDLYRTEYPLRQWCCKHLPINETPLLLNQALANTVILLRTANHFRSGLLVWQIYTNYIWIPQTNSNDGARLLEPPADNATRAWTVTKDISLPGERTGNIRPDFVMRTGATLDWGLVLVVGEHQSAGPFAKGLQAQLASYAEQLFISQPFQTSVWAILTSKTKP